MTPKERTPLGTKIATALLGLVLGLVGLAFVAVVALVVAGIGWSAWQAYKAQDPTLLLLLPVALVGAARDSTRDVPAYVWLGLVFLLWMEWRLGRLEAAVHSVADALRERRRPPDDPDRLTQGFP